MVDTTGFEPANRGNRVITPAHDAIGNARQSIPVLGASDLHPQPYSHRDLDHDRFYPAHPSIKGLSAPRFWWWRSLLAYVPILFSRTHVESTNIWCAPRESNPEAAVSETARYASSLQKREILATLVGLEPTTARSTGGCSPSELQRQSCWSRRQDSPTCRGPRFVGASHIDKPFESCARCAKAHRSSTNTLCWSRRQDSNLRSPGPEPGALACYATARVTGELHGSRTHLADLKDRRPHPKSSSSCSHSPAV